MPITPAPTTTIEAGNAVELQDAVRVEDRALVELDLGRPAGVCRLRSRSFGSSASAPAVPSDAATVCGSRKRALARDDVDVVARELVADDVDLAVDHVLVLAESSSIVISSLTR